MGEVFKIGYVCCFILELKWLCKPHSSKIILIYLMRGLCSTSLHTQLEIKQF